MNNITKYKGQRIKDRYKDGAEKLYALCDYMNKRAMIWYTLNIEFSPNEVELIKRVQQTMEDMKAISKNVDEEEDIFDYLDLGYEVGMQNCPECNGKVKVVNFAVNGMGHEFNIYKCMECSKETQEVHPNKPEHERFYIDSFYKMYDTALSSKTIDDNEKIIIKEKLVELQNADKITMESEEEVQKNRAILKASVLAAIASNGEMYKELYKFKHHFDRNIGEA